MSRELRRARARTLAALILLGAIAVVLQQAGVRMRVIARLNDERIDLAAQREAAPSGVEADRILDEIRKIETDLENLQKILPDEFDLAVEREEVEREAASVGVRVLFASYREEPDEDFRKCEAKVFLLGPEARIDALLERFWQRARLRSWKREKGRPGCVWGVLSTYARARRASTSPVNVVPAETLWLWPFTSHVRRAEADLQAARKELESERKLVDAVNRFELLREELQTVVDFIQARHVKPGSEDGEPEEEAAP